MQPLPIPEMSKTLQDNLKKGKFLTNNDSEQMHSQNQLSKLKPIKQRIEEAEREQFWSEFSNDPKKVAGKHKQSIHDSSMQATGISYKHNVEQPYANSGADPNGMLSGGALSGDQSVNRNKKAQIKAFHQDRNSTVVQAVGLKDNLNSNQQQQADG